MLQTTFGLSKEYLQFLDKENSTQNEGEDTYTLIFINGEKEVFKKGYILKDLGESNEKLQDAWTEIKAK